MPAVLAATLVREVVKPSFASLLDAPELTDFTVCRPSDQNSPDAPASIYSVFLASKKRELSNYLEFVRRQLEALDAQRLSDEAFRAGAKTLVEGMRFEKNGYFYAYRDSPLELMAHPFAAAGQTFAQEDSVKALVACANQYPSGGLLLYRWQNPSDQGEERKAKLGIVGMVPRGWVVGTGLYLDDYEKERREMRNSLSRALDAATGLTFLGVFALVLMSLVASSWARRASYEREVRAAGQSLEQQERARMARELHDGLLQVLSSALGHLRGLGSSAPAALCVAARAGNCRQNENQHERTEALGRGLSAVEAAAHEARRIAEALSPLQLEKLGLSKAIEALACDLQRSQGVQVSVTTRGTCDGLQPETQAACYRIAQEALNNVAKHSRARHVEVRLVRDADQFVLGVTDDGQGFDEHHPANLGGMGLANMRERVRLAGGTFEVRSRPGCTEVVARFPSRPQSLFRSRILRRSAERASRGC